MKKNQIIIIFIVLLSIKLTAQTQLDSTKANFYKSKISIHNKTNNFDSLILYNSKLIELYQHKREWIKLIATNNKISKLYYKEMMYDISESFLLDNLDIIQKKNINEINTYIGNTYNILGTIYYQKAIYNKAISYSEKSLDIFKKIDGISMSKISGMCTNLGVFYSKINKYKKAISYHKHSLNIENNNPNPSNKYLTSIYLNIGRLYGNIRDYDIALDYYNKAMSISTEKDNNYYAAYLNFAVTHQLIGNYEISLKLLKNISTENPNYNRFDRILKHIGTSYFHMGDNKEALKNLIKSYNLKKSIYKYKHPNIATTLIAIGDVYNKIDDKKNALINYQKSIVDLCLNFNDSTGISNPKLELISDKAELLIALRKKATTLAKLNKTEVALETYLLSIDLNESIGYQHSDLESRNFQYQETKAIYEKAIELAYQLYEQSKQHHYLEIAFQIAERSKSSLLVQSLQDTKAHYIGGVPLALIEKEKELTIEISFYENKLFKTKNEADKSKMEQALFHKREDLDKLIDQLEKDYPKYYEEKYSRNEILIADVQQQQDSNQVFIEYFYGTDAYYMIAINNTTAKIVKQQNSADLENNIHRFLSSVNSNQHFEHGEETYNSYSSAAYYLYQQLLEPLHNITKEKQLSISRDGILSYIPFEALLYEKPNALADYRKAAYLIKKHSIHYAFSAGLNYKNNSQQGNYNTSFAGYAPDYGKGSLQKLHWNHEEVNNAAHIFDGNAFTGDHANKAHFMTHKNESQILHLAMHANADSINPMHSRLLFGEKSEKESLYAYELCNMDIASELVVLSACETGAGQLINGEGVMSLARSFFYAGCPSVIMSQWQLDDRTSTEIMQYFYQYLDDGKNKSEALQLAKLDFINKSGPIKANPVYWASIVSVGNPRPIKNSSSKVWYYSLLLLLPVGFYYIRKRKQEQAA